MVLSDESLGRWCESSLGSRIVARLFERGHLSRVLGVSLANGHEVVIKIRPWQDRLRACVAVQRHLATAGYPCPAPLGDVDHVDGLAVSAEFLISGGKQRDPDLGAGPYATLLGRLIAMAPEVASLPTLLPAPPWTAWDHPAATTWPERDDRGTNLNLVDGPAWIDDSARRARELLSAYEAPLRIGHGDWESQNIRWVGDDPLAVHDWDSVIAQPEATIVGLAAAVWPPGGAATVTQTTQFLDAYQTAFGDWSEHDRAAAWAAGLWVRLFNAKKDAGDGGGPQLDRLRHELDERLYRAGLAD
jgi:Ser/Thr protein kinase RdoA (MazF antagonist)